MYHFKTTPPSVYKVHTYLCTCLPTQTLSYFLATYNSTCIVYLFCLYSTIPTYLHFVLVLALVRPFARSLSAIATDPLLLLVCTCRRSRLHRQNCGKSQANPASPFHGFIILIASIRYHNPIQSNPFQFNSVPIHYNTRPRGQTTTEPVRQIVRPSSFLPVAPCVTVYPPWLIAPFRSTAQLPVCTRVCDPHGSRQTCCSPAFRKWACRTTAPAYGPLAYHLSAAFPGRQAQQSTLNDDGQRGPFARSRQRVQLARHSTAPFVPPRLFLPAPISPSCHRIPFRSRSKGKQRR